MRHNGKRIQGLYPIIDSSLLSIEIMEDVARKIISAGARTLQLRAKELTPTEMIEIGKRLKKLCSAHNALFIINDRIDIALITEADGVHIGQDDLPPTEARKLLGTKKIIGYSTHNEMEVQQADMLFRQGVIDYISFGPIFGTTTKKDASPVVGIEKLKKIRSLTKAPITAIGGINVENFSDVITAGADAVAMISCLLKSPDIEHTVSTIIDRLREIETA